MKQTRRLIALLVVPLLLAGLLLGCRSDDPEPDPAEWAWTTAETTEEETTTEEYTTEEETTEPETTTTTTTRAPAPPPPPPTAAPTTAPPPPTAAPTTAPPPPPTTTRPADAPRPNPPPHTHAVPDGAVLVERVVLGGSSTVAVGGSLWPRFTVTGAGGAEPYNLALYWTSSNPAVATVEPFVARVIGRSPGVVYIFAHAMDGSGVWGSLRVTVT